MLNLDNITIISVNTKDPEQSVKALRRSCKYINFKKTILLSDKHIKDDLVETIKINSINSLGEYSYFCVKYLHEYIKTDFCLIVQPDGFVTNPLMWTDEFLNYDYIGAPWDLLLSRQALFNCGHYIADLSKVPIIVGNGGFSLRSKKLLVECSSLDYPNTQIPEDNFICITSREHLKNKDIKFANIKTAKRFSFECPIDLNKKNITLDAHFGFHGGHGFKQPLLDLLENYEDDLPSVKIAKQIWIK